MKASKLPAVEGCPHFFVRSAYRWCRGPCLEGVIHNLGAKHLEIVQVFRCSPEAYLEAETGKLVCKAKGDTWEGRVWGKKDITLKRILIPTSKSYGQNL